MVGHTGVYDAACRAMETVDKCLSRVVPAILAKGGVALITAAHGNHEEMIDLVNGGPFTAHTTNDVWLIGAGLDQCDLSDGRLADLAPTMLELLGLERSPWMTGRSLLLC